MPKRMLMLLIKLNFQLLSVHGICGILASGSLFDCHYFANIGEAFEW